MGFLTTSLGKFGSVVGGDILGGEEELGMKADIKGTNKCSFVIMNNLLKAF